MKQVLLRLHDDVHAELSRLAKAKGVSLAAEIRQAFEAHLVNSEYSARGRPLFWESPDGRQRTEVVLPAYRQVPRAGA